MLNKPNKTKKVIKSQVAILKPTHFVHKNAEELTDILFTLIEEVREKRTTYEEAEIISKVADKIIKNNLIRLMNRKVNGGGLAIEYFKPTPVPSNGKTTQK